MIENDGKDNKDRVWVPLGKTITEWEAEVRKRYHEAGRSEKAFALGTGTAVELEDGTIWIVGLIGALCVGQRNGRPPVSDVGEWPSRINPDWKPEQRHETGMYLDDPRIIVAYSDPNDPTQIRDELGAMKFVGNVDDI